MVGAVFGPGGTSVVAAIGRGVVPTDGGYRREPVLMAWDLTAGGDPPVVRLEWQPSGITAVACAGESLVTGYQNGVAKLWPLRQLLA